MRYPSWLPHPKAWGQAIAFSIQLFIQGIPLAIAGKFGLEILRETAKNVVLSRSERMLISLIVLVAIGFYSLLMIYTMSLIHQFLWDEPHPKFPKWFPRWRCWGEGIWGMFIILVSTGLGLAFISFTYQAYDQTIEEALITLSIAEFILIAYCFHFRALIAKSISINRKKNTNPNTNQN